MASREFTFIETRAPRATGLSERAVDEHKALIGDLYLSRNYTRDEVIEYLKTNLSFSLSRDQFSKATRRWGFQKQRRGGSTIQLSLSEAASQCTTSDAARNESLRTANIDDSWDQEPTVTSESSKRPRSAAGSKSRRSDTMTHGPSSPFIRPLVKRMKPKDEPDNAPAESLPHTQLDFSNDTDLMLTPSVEEELAESRSKDEERCDDELSADYLACCYHYDKAFWYYRKISAPLPHETFSPKQRRDRILNMARTAKTRRASEIVREMMESELEISTDPLSEDGLYQVRSGRAEMCPVQSLLFHRHLSEIYYHRSDASLAQKHSDTAGDIAKLFDTYTPALPRVNLWILPHLPSHEVADISENLLNLLRWEGSLLVSNMRDCLRHCWIALTDTEPLPKTIPHDVGQHEAMNLNDMSQSATQHDPFCNWIQSSLLFTFLWKKIQDKTATDWDHHSISATQFLMVISRIIVRRSLLLHRHDILSPNSQSRPLELQASSRRVYCRAVLHLLLDDHRYMVKQMEREFVTAFREHYSWSPPAGHKSVIAREIQAYQMEALDSVLTARRKLRATAPTSTILKDDTALTAEYVEMRCTSNSEEYLYWLIWPEDELVFPREREAVPCFPGSRYTASVDSSDFPSYSRTRPSADHIALNPLSGNPTMCRSLASHSSRASQVSVSSSFKRFKASALKRRPSSESMVGLDLSDPARRLEDNSLHELQDLQGGRYSKATMSLSTLVEDELQIPQKEGYTGHKEKLEED